eukprot:TRINITY_DN65650_c0_g1_i1.p1 TRINITY_DN65650_c0_g1~~TRINITY_DN65650_c0_g1_i1.p1  ORF type:complete len:381 (-),score=52.32 TRINITY_DN65650_c0_g1_i1:25-1080(-)
MLVVTAASLLCLNVGFASGCKCWAVARPVFAGRVSAPRWSECRVQALSNSYEASSSPSGKRRLVAGLGVAGLGILEGLLWGTGAALAAAGSIVILGANGKTGQQCVKVALQRGERVVATSRTGVLSEPAACSGQCRVQVADVTRPETLKAAVADARGVIFAASQSKAGGTAKAVDNDGLVNTAQACIAAKVKRLVVVSSGAVSRPDSAVYNFLNLFGNIMAEKITGENRIRSLYASLPPGSNLGYTIVRPGGLVEEGVEGAVGVEVTQGDRFSGRISRVDVAGLCLAAVDSEAAKNATLECYYADTRKPLESVGFSNIFRQKTEEDTSGQSGALRGNTFEQILAGAKADTI